MAWPVLVFQRRTLLSAPAVASCSPSARKSSQLTRTSANWPPDWMSVDVEQPQIRGCARRNDPFARDVADVDLDEFDVLDRGFASRPHTGAQGRQIEFVRSKRNSFLA